MYINKKKVPLKYLIGAYDLHPTQYDLLYELCELLVNENKQEFNEWELKNKTKSRFGSLDENLQFLIDNEFVAKTKYSKYTILKHPWE